MKISHEWLARFVPHGRDAAAIRDLITAHVATVEGFEHLRADLAPFVVGRVVESERIPETKLSFNKVDDGSGTLLEVVCGAPNVTVGAKYPFARSGTRVPPSAKNPTGLLIERRKIRGFTSNGMLCSAQELNLGDDADGILTLETDAPPGTPLLAVLPAGDAGHGAEETSRVSAGVRCVPARFDVTHQQFDSRTGQHHRQRMDHGGGKTDDH